MAFKNVWINYLGRLPAAVSTRWWLRWSGQRLVLPFYHTVADEYVPHISPLYPPIGVSQFESDLDHLLQYFKPISASELMHLVRNGNQPERPVVHLSFDDGLRQCRDVIAPVLLRKGLPATFFINSGFVNNRALFYRYKAALLLDRWRNMGETERHNLLDKFNLTGRASFERMLRSQTRQQQQLDELGKEMQVDFNDYLRNARPYMDADEITWLQRQGFAIGSHSVDHPYFSGIDAAQRQQQVLESLDYVEREWGVKERFFAFPFTDHGVPADFSQWLHRPGGGNVDLSFGTAGMKHDVVPAHLQRIPMEGYKVHGKQVINGELSYYLMKKWMGRTVVKR